METSLSNNLGLQISNDGILLDVDLDFNLLSVVSVLCFSGKVGLVGLEQE